METKKCRICLSDKEVISFNKNNRNKDKLNTMCKDCQKEYLKNYRKENYTKVLNQEKVYDLKNKDKRKNYRVENKVKINDYQKKYRIDNTDKVRRAILKSKNTRYKNDILFVLKENIRRTILRSFKQNNMLKTNNTLTILGCSFEEFKLHLESKFEPWMNWDNKGNWNGVPTEINTAWDIDHIVPISTTKTEDDVIRLNHYTNLQPLCSYTNRNLKRNYQ